MQQSRAALTRSLVKAAFVKTTISEAFLPDALIAADAFIESCSVKTEFYVGQGAQRGQPAFSADDNISPMSQCGTSRSHSSLQNSKLFALQVNMCRASLACQ